MLIKGRTYDNRFAWVTRWNTDAVIVELRGYLDSALIYQVVTEGESGEFTYTDERNTLRPGPIGSNCRA